MGIVFRQSFKTTIATYIGQLIGALTLLLTIKILPQKELGISRDLIYRGIVLQPFLMMGAGAIVFIYMLRYKCEDQRASIVTWSFVIPLISTALFCIPYFLFRTQITSRSQPTDRPYIEAFFWLVPLLGLLSSYMSMLDFFLRTKMKVAYSAFMREVLLKSCSLPLIALYYWQSITFHQYVVGTVIAYFIPLLFLLQKARKEPEFKIIFKTNLFTKAEVRDMVIYAWYHMLSGATLLLMGYLDSLLLIPLSKQGSKDTAVYAPAVFMIAFMAVPFRAMMSAAYPKIAEAYSNKDHGKVENLFVRANVNILIVSLLVFMIVLVNLPNLRTFISIYKPEYAILPRLVFILSIGSLIDVATGLNSEVIAVTPYYKFIFRSSLLLILSIVLLDRIFIPKYGVTGAAWVTTITTATFNIAKMFYLYSKTGLFPLVRKSYVLFSATMTVGVLVYLLPNYFTPILNTIIKTFLVSTLFIFIVLWLKPSPDIKDFVNMRKR